MAGIKSINTLLEKKGKKYVQDLLSQEVRITEMFDAFRFSFEKDAKTQKFQYYGKNGKTPLNLIDRTISDLYEGAIQHIENLPFEIKKSIPYNQRFGFSWFPSNNPLEIKYEKRPRNGLILTNITLKNNFNKEVFENHVFERWADIFFVDYAKPIFEGFLQKETINSLIQSCQNFSLNSLKESEIFTPGFLNHTQENIEALVFRFPNDLVKLGKEKSSVNEKRSHLFDILLLNIYEHLESFNLTKIKNLTNDSDEGYIEIVSEIFNDYVYKKGHEFVESGLEKPKFLEKSGNFSRKWIHNQKTLAILNENNKYEYLLSIFLVNLKKPRYSDGLISESVAFSFNQKIEEINKLAGNDFGFLEFSAIQKINEIIDNDDILPNQPDYVKAVSLLTRFFDNDRKQEKGKKNVNVIIINAIVITNDIIKEAERLKKLNGLKTLIFHDQNLFSKSYGTEEYVINSTLKKLVHDYSELFIGFKIIDIPFYKKIINSLRPEYEPIIIVTEERKKDMELEKDAYQSLYKEKENAPSIESFRKHSKIKLEKCLEDNEFKKFQELTPECMHPYWEQIKSSFDRFYYKEN